MLLYNIQDLSKSYGSKKLFQELSLSIFAGDRIGLIGLNGSGKSTFLEILAGLKPPDEGVCSPRRGLKIGYIPQRCEFPDKKPVDVILDSLSKEEGMADHERETTAKLWLGKLGFTGEEKSAALLSGGWKKRLMVAKEMAHSPDLLLLDEPTNHLDLEGILFLEKFLLREVATYLLVSHDRYFLEHLTNRTIEISSAFPKGLFSIKGSYDFFLQKKAEFLEGQLEQEGAFRAKARRESAWLKRSPKARTSKSKARIDEANELFDELSKLSARNRQSRAVIDFEGSERETKKLVVAKNLSKILGGKMLFQELDFILSPGSRLGLLGPNGSGKSSLLKILADELLPDNGTLKKADLLQVVYFDQHRNVLADTTTLRDALSPNGDYVHFRGQFVHVNGWCKRFLFDPDRLDLPVGKLSGGERARISIAHLMLKPADLLLLDEPTNDLDIPTLEILEENLLEFPGAVVLISHDRFMMNRLCTGFLALNGSGKHDFFVDYYQWEEAQQEQNKLPIEKELKKEEVRSAGSAIPIKLTYAEKKELEGMEERILFQEAELQRLTSLLDEKTSMELQEVCTAISVVSATIEELYLRWDVLLQKAHVDKK